MSLTREILVAGRVIGNCALTFRSIEELGHLYAELQTIYGVAPVVVLPKRKRETAFSITDLQQWLHEYQHLLPAPQKPVSLTAFEVRTTQPPVEPPPIPSQIERPPFDLIVLDFDDTMAYTTPLESLRSSPSQPPGWDEALKQCSANGQVRQWLLKLQRLDDPPRLAVISAARRWYLTDLLDRAFRDVQFEAVLGYDDAAAAGRCFKPDPALLLQVMDSVGASPERTLVIGDSRKDMEMAFRAGAKALQVDFYSSRINAFREQQHLSRSNEYFHALKALPHGVCREASHLQHVTSHFARYDLPLEAIHQGVSPRDLCRPEMHFTVKEFVGDQSVEVTFLGRYFTAPSQVKGTYPLPERVHHQLSREILQKEDGDDSVPVEWIQAIVPILERWADRPTVVTIIPAKKGRPARNENLLDLLKVGIQSNRHLRFEAQVFAFTHDAESNKALDREGRCRNLKQHLMVHESAHLQPDHRYVVLDDVSTTGATFMRTRDLLTEHGMHQHRFLSVAKAHSFKPFKERT